MKYMRYLKWVAIKGYKITLAPFYGLAMLAWVLWVVGVLNSHNVSLFFSYYGTFSVDDWVKSEGVWSSLFYLIIFFVILFHIVYSVHCKQIAEKIYVIISKRIKMRQQTMQVLAISILSIIMIPIILYAPTEKSTRDVPFPPSQVLEQKPEIERAALVMSDGKLKSGSAIIEQLSDSSYKIIFQQ
ncbi:hypothetical protein H0A36_17530 [Endozoicomonas sp. SM1973]|uniref:Uncharacterized protein n=1 Tax=Spartinivicinus marinus TaxID=2994442 RepID=A0A853IB11_9GAMM|nr:hypothetical protein [Spartinivicinus marinus]MCX4030175.1 hypothetical protein [Spartinivicinus marinus]NYZ67818.1 hypothetical protein [Spartinivicinus marinus]